MKRVLTGIWVLCLMLFICLLVSFISNEAMIAHYEKGEYEENKLSFLAFTETYIKHYNQGNLYYKKKEYEKALEEYKKALELNPPYDRECMIRVNMALCMVIPINPEEIDSSNLQEVIQTLEEAQAILTEHGCAAEGDKDGHNADAQQLYEDIEKFKKELLNSNESEDDKKEKKKQKPEESKVENADEKKEQIKNLQDQSTKERQSDSEKSKAINDFEFYDGDSW